MSMTAPTLLKQLQRAAPLLLLVLVPLGLRAVQQRRPVQAIAHTIEAGELTREVFGRGAIESEREAALGFDLSGRIAEVLVVEGQRVTMGQELARLDLDQARAELDVASSTVAASRAALARLAADESRAQIALDAATRERARTQALLRVSAIAPIDLDTALDRERLARAELDRVLAQRGEASRSISVARRGADARQATLTRATLLAPFDGIITRRLKEPGDTASVGATVLRLVDAERVYARAWIDESALGALAEGQPATITAPDGRTLRAEVSRVGVEADRQTHEILVDIRPVEPMGRVAIGQRADVWVQVETRADAVRLPVAFIQREGDALFVQVDDAGKIARRAIKVGLSGREAVQVEGLAAGELVLRAVKPGAALPLGRPWVSP
jgi:HlyD family secretion protein